MKKYIIITISLVFSITNSFSQDFSKELQGITKVKILDLYGNLTIKGITQSKIQVSKVGQKEIPVDVDKAKPEYYKTENTRIGLCLENKDGVVTISPANQQAQFTNYDLQFPNNVLLEIKIENLDKDIEINDTKNTEIFNDIAVKNMKGEINIELYISDIEMYDVTGPLALALIGGNLFIDFSELNQQYPSKIELLTGNIDVRLPENEKFDVDLGVNLGDIYSEYDIDVSELKHRESGVTFGGHLADKTENTGKKFDASKLIGKVNGGGTRFSINTFAGTVNLKKK